jgi:hypothetical protein
MSVNAIAMHLPPPLYSMFSSLFFVPSCAETLGGPPTGMSEVSIDYGAHSAIEGCEGVEDLMMRAPYKAMGSFLAPSTNFQVPYGHGSSPEYNTAQVISHEGMDHLQPERDQSMAIGIPVPNSAGMVGALLRLRDWPSAGLPREINVLGINSEEELFVQQHLHPTLIYHSVEGYGKASPKEAVH